MCYYYGTFYIHSVQGDEADINDDIDNNDNNEVKGNNDNDNIFDEDYDYEEDEQQEDDADVEERDTFDLDCNDKVADDFFSSVLFRNAVKLPRWRGQASTTASTTIYPPGSNERRQ